MAAGLVLVLVDIDYQIVDFVDIENRIEDSVDIDYQIEKFEDFENSDYSKQNLLPPWTAGLDSESWRIETDYCFVYSIFQVAWTLGNIDWRNS